MKTMRLGLVACVLLNLAGQVVEAQTPAHGSAINVPLVGRLIGGGNTLFRTAVDVTNNTNSPVVIDFYLDGTDGATGAGIVANGSITSSGGIGVRGQGGAVRSRFNAHFDDFVDALIQAGRIPDTLRANGFIGSVLFVFNGRDKAGQAAVTARFYNAFGGGNVGVALKGREITANEPQQLVATVLDTRGSSNGAPQMYPNLFVNNTGIAAGGSHDVAGPVTVEISAISNTTGQAIGTPIIITDLQPGRTASIGQVLNALQIATSVERTILVFVRVTSGNAAIQGLISQVDDVTRDGALFEMSRADF